MILGLADWAAGYVGSALSLTRAVGGVTVSADATGGFRKAKHSPKANGVKDSLFIGNLEFNVKTELAR